MAAFGVPAAEDGLCCFQLWDPLAHQVWWTLRGGKSHHALERVVHTRPEDEGVWQVTTPCSEGAEYAFLVEWTQELRHSGTSSHLGIPHEGGIGWKEPPKQSKDPPDVTSRESSNLTGVTSGACPASSSSSGKYGTSVKTSPGASTQQFVSGVSAAAADSDLADFAGSPSSLKGSVQQREEDLGAAEFLCEIQDLSQYIVDAEGVRVRMLAAPQLVVLDIVAYAADGSWGPCHLKQSETAYETKEGSVQLWLGSIPAFRTTGEDEMKLRIRRRDWRMDPCALVLVPDPLACKDARCPATASVQKQNEQRLPEGPLMWSRLVNAPTARCFNRCSDQELVVYELHLGSFTQEGTFQAAKSRLGHVRDLGCTAVALMPVQQDSQRALKGKPDFWGYDVISFCAVDHVHGTPADLVALVDEAHWNGLAVIADLVVNHMFWGSDLLIGPAPFVAQQDTVWGPRPDFAKPRVRSWVLAAVELYLLRFGFDGVRVDSTKSIRKFPGGAFDPAGTRLLCEITALCRKHGRLAIAEDLEDGEGLLQLGGLGFHLQWDMALFCWAYDALVNPLDEHRNFDRVTKGLQGLSPWRTHPLRGRLIFMETHDTASSNRYGRIPAAVHHGGPFFVSNGEDDAGDAFQKSNECLPYPASAEVEANDFAFQRTAIGLVILMTTPGTPMLLQGQEVFDFRPYAWPNGPPMDWQRVGTKQGPAFRCKQLVQKLISLRVRLRTGVSEPQQRPGPFMGDGLHVFHSHAGVLSYLRWAEDSSSDSRQQNADGLNLGLVIVNCSNMSFPNYDLGVPPSHTWKLVFSSTAELEGSEDISSTTLLSTSFEKARHGFPCSIDTWLPRYSALVFLKNS